MNFGEDRIGHAHKKHASMEKMNHISKLNFEFIRHVILLVIN